MQGFPSICGVLTARAERQPEAPAFVFLSDGEVEARRTSYASLHHEALGIAANLRARLHEGDRALLLYADELDFIAAFFGCLYAKVVPVPFHPPRSTRRLDACVAVVRNCKPSV